MASGHAPVAHIEKSARVLAVLICALLCHAVQNFARQARAAAAHGLSVLQETPSYAFLMACQDIAMRQLSSEENSLQGSADAAAAAQQPAGDAAARAAQEGSSRAAQSLGNHADGLAGVLGPACGFAGTASAGGAARGGVSTGGQQQQFNQPHTATAAAGGVSTRGQQQQFNQLHPAAAAAGGVSTAGQQQQQLRQEGQAVVDVDAPSSPTRALQHQLGLYYRQVVNLNIFLADTLTLEQALTLNIACKCTNPQTLTLTLTLTLKPQPSNPKTHNHFSVVLRTSVAYCDPRLLML